MYADEEYGDEVSEAYGEVRPNLLVDYGRKTADEAGCSEEQRQEHGTQVRLKGPESGLQGKHRQGGGRPARVPQEHRRAVTKHGLLRGSGTRRRSPDRRYEPPDRRGPG